MQEPAGAGTRGRAGAHGVRWGGRRMEEGGSLDREPVSVEQDPRRPESFMGDSGKGICKANRGTAERPCIPPRELPAGRACSLKPCLVAHPPSCVPRDTSKGRDLQGRACLDAGGQNFPVGLAEPSLCSGQADLSLSPACVFSHQPLN